MKCRKRVLTVLVVDQNKEVRDALAKHFCRYDWPVFRPRHDEVRVFRALGVVEAQRKIEELYPRYPEVVIFSQDFPETEIDRLRQWIHEKELVISFRGVQLGEPVFV